jgi:hypothetical protein
MCPLSCSFCIFRVLNYLQLLTNISETLVSFVLMLQFYFTTRAELDYLDGKHTVFGEVAEGLDTLMRINEAFVDENHKPYKNIRYTSCFINMTSKIRSSVFEDLKSLVLVHQTDKPNVNS